MTLIISEIKTDGYERVVEFTDDTGFQCYIAIHNTSCGPGLGGCRVKSYASNENAFTDVLRLSKGMTYKSALAGLNFGGAKMVINAPKATREIMLKAGECVEYFDGQYITAEDVGTTLDQVHIMREVTQHTAQLDGSSMTARGVVVCMRAALKYQNKWGDMPLGMPVWVQGLGKVGMDVAHRLDALNTIPRTLHGLDLYVSDLRPEAIKEAEEFGAREITEDDKRFIEIYSPCAMGQVINDTNVNSTKYSIICGSANNQLVDESYAEILQNNGVIYVPDYLCNSGGVINAAMEIGVEFDQEACEKATDAIGDKLLEVFAIAKEENITPLAAANKLAESRFI
jgi:leucine dehydrogenase